MTSFLLVTSIPRTQMKDPSREACRYYLSLLQAEPGYHHRKTSFYVNRRCKLFWTRMWLALMRQLHATTFLVQCRNAYFAVLLAQEDATIDLTTQVAAADVRIPCVPAISLVLPAMLLFLYLHIVRAGGDCPPPPQSYFIALILLPCRLYHPQLSARAICFYL